MPLDPNKFRPLLTFHQPSSSSSSTSTQKNTPITSLSYTPDGTYLFTSSSVKNNHYVSLINPNPQPHDPHDLHLEIPNALPIRNYPTPHTSHITNVTTLPSNTHFFTSSSRDTSMYMVDVTVCGTSLQLNSSTSNSNANANAGAEITTTSTSSWYTRKHLESLKSYTRKFAGHTGGSSIRGGVTATAVNFNGTVLCSGGVDSTVRLWDLKSAGGGGGRGGEIMCLTNGTDSITHVCAGSASISSSSSGSSSGSGSEFKITTADASGNVFVYDIRKGMLSKVKFEEGIASFGMPSGNVLNGGSGGVVVGSFMDECLRVFSLTNTSTTTNTNNITSSSGVNIIKTFKSKHFVKGHSIPCGFTYSNECVVSGSVGYGGFAAYALNFKDGKGRNGGVCEEGTVYYNETLSDKVPEVLAFDYDEENSLSLSQSNEQSINKSNEMIASNFNVNPKYNPNLHNNIPPPPKSSSAYYNDDEIDNYGNDDYVTSNKQREREHENELKLQRDRDCQRQTEIENERLKSQQIAREIEKKRRQQIKDKQEHNRNSVLSNISIHPNADRVACGDFNGCGVIWGRVDSS